MTRIQAPGTALTDAGEQRAAGPPPPRRTRRGWVLGLTSAAYFMVVLDALVVITALPQMQRDLHVGLPVLQWTVNSYGIAFAAGIITAAALGDRLGRRRSSSRAWRCSPSPRPPVPWRPARPRWSPPGPCRAWAARPSCRSA
jgi:hypothetical protein